MLRITASTVVALLLLVGVVQANFLETELGARAMGMGGAFVAVADDVTALHWNPAGLANLRGVQFFGMRTSVYSVDGLSEDAALASYGTGSMGYGAGWMRTGAEDLYSENTLLAGYGTETPIDGLTAGVVLKRFSIEAPGYEYYNDPAFATGGDDAYSADLGALYRHGKWSIGGTVRNLGEPELQLLDSTADEDLDPVISEFRLGGSYLFRDIMLMTAEWRVPREVPEYYENRYSINLGTEVWFYDAFALRAGMNRDRITAGLGVRTKHVQIDVALLSERRIGSLYRLSASFGWGGGPPTGTPAMAREPVFTRDLINEVRWSDEEARGAAEYYAECSEDGSFDSGVRKSGWVPMNSYEFDGLEDGRTYFYRAKARARGGSASDWSVPVHSTQDASPPRSEIEPVPDHLTLVDGSATVSLAFTASDAGSGVDFVELMYRLDGGPYRSAGRYHGSSGGGTLTLDAPGHYDFVSVGTDSSGNVEVVSGSPERSVVVDAPDVPDWSTVAIDILFESNDHTVPPQFDVHLDRLAEWLLDPSNISRRVLIEGHCDERGTNDHNMALGRRRAQTVKEQLVERGVDYERLDTVSHGGERPLDTGHNKEAWAKNRRAHFVPLR